MYPTTTLFGLLVAPRLIDLMLLVMKPEKMPGILR